MFSEAVMAGGAAATAGVRFVYLYFIVLSLIVVVKMLTLKKQDMNTHIV